MTEERPQPSLTNREHDILELIADGLSNQQIADHLTISLHTVKWYVKQLFVKLNVSRRTQAVSIAQSLGLLQAASNSYSLNSHLPTPITPFVGRETELAELNRILDTDNIRLVTLLGTGGVGKTRLAIALAWHRRHLTPDEVVYVPLEGITSPGGVVTAVAHAMGFQFSGQMEPRQQLLLGIHRRCLLLILDNFEHLLEANSFVSDLLKAAPGIQILTTSRERLNLSAETIFPLQGLDYASSEETSGSLSAVHLFTQTAQRTRAAFHPDTSDTQHINRICQLVDGLPLAIELASSWIDVLSPEQIIAEIEDSLEILQAKSQDIPARHRSMHAVFEHSWNMLTQEEQTVFSRLSLFRGGFDREAAEAIAGTSFFNLSTLMGKSLITRVADNRFQLHNLVRQFAVEMLNRDAQELHQTYQQFSAYYAVLMRKFEEVSKTNPSATVLYFADIQPETENVLTGWRWAVKEFSSEYICDYIYGLSLMCEFSSLPQLAESEFASAIDKIGTVNFEIDPILSIRLKTHHGWALGALMMLEEAVEELLSAHGRVQELENPISPDVGQLCSFTGWLLHMSGESDRGSDFLKRGLRTCQQSEFVWFECISLTQLGSIAADGGDLVTARQHYQQALLIAEEHDVIIGLLYILPLLGYVDCILGDVDVAKVHLRSSLKLNQSRPVVASVLMTIVGIAALYSTMNKTKTALELIIIILHHPQVGTASLQLARNLGKQLEPLLPDNTLQELTEQVERGLSPNSHVEPGFAITLSFVNNLIELLSHVD